MVRPIALGAAATIGESTKSPAQDRAKIWKGRSSAWPAAVVNSTLKGSVNATKWRSVAIPWLAAMPRAHSSAAARTAGAFCVAGKAAIRAGYSAKTARVIGHENLIKPDIAAVIAKRPVIAESNHLTF